ncbi:MAG: hypothetical protein HQL90_13290, partial [Magnetococcales bacterium]|nr:hypothetical protein [Magnetococcales bacterium]
KKCLRATAICIIHAEPTHDLVFPAKDTDEGVRPLSFSFGVESRSNFILSTCINKGTRAEELVERAHMIRRKGFFLDGYVLLGKPFLSAQEDVEDAIETIHWASGLGAEYLFVMVTNRVAGSLADHLIACGRWSLPSLWRAVRLLEMLPPQLRRLVQIKGINHAPYPPMEYATSCSRCRDQVVQILNFWNQTGDFEHIRELPVCACRERFEAEEWTEHSEHSLAYRLHESYVRLATDFSIDPGLVPSLTLLDEMWREKHD